MPDSPNKLSQFWQELRRRKVVRVITVYAAAAFVILELVSIIVEPLKLPEWTLTFIIVLLCAGLIIAIILSWIFDIHPEGGIIKSEPSKKVLEESVPASSKSWRIASYISFVVIVALIVLNIIPRTGKKEVLEKSIAILPFINDSPDQERMYFINGTMEAILDNLSKIKNIRVVSRTSVEQYRNNPIPIPVVAEEMDVSYVLEGSGHRDGDNIRLFIQLLDGRKDQHLWSNTYNGNIEDIFSMLSEIAQQVAGEIEAIITPAERALIEKKPTESQTAYDLYIKAFQFDDPSEREELLRLSLEFDSTFIWPYNQLGWEYFHKYENAFVPQPADLDSVRKFVNKALLYDDQDAGVYNLRGYYYRMIGESDMAMDDFNRALELSPNLAAAVEGIVWLAMKYNDFQVAIQNLHQAVSINRGRSLLKYYRSLSEIYFQLGFKQLSDLYSQKLMELDGDSVRYYYEQARNEFWISHNVDRALELLEKGYSIDENNIDILILIGRCYEHYGQYDKALFYYENQISQFSDLRRMPYYWKNLLIRSYRMTGNSEAADTMMNQQINNLKTKLKLEKENLLYMLLAQIYALIGEKEEVYKYLNAHSRMERTNIHFTSESIKIEGFFNEMFDEPDFQLILEKNDAKYMVQHERVRQWLEENDML